MKLQSLVDCRKTKVMTMMMTTMKVIKASSIETGRNHAKQIVSTQYTYKVNHFKKRLRHLTVNKPAVFIICIVSGTCLLCPTHIFVDGLFHFKFIQAYGRHFLLTFYTPEIQGRCMNFSPGKLGDCYEHFGIQGMVLEVPGFQGVLCNDPGFPGVSVQPP